jgi:fucose permease
MATLLLIIIYLGFIGLGLPDSLLGTAWPDIYRDLSIPVSLEAIGNSSIVIGTIVSSMNATRLIQRLGTHKITVFSTLLTACAIFGYGFAPSFLWILLLGIPMGIGAGAIDVALNNYMAIHFKASHMNWLHCFWGLGATAGPMVMSSFMHQDLGWRYGYYTIGAAQLLIVILLIVSTPVWRVQEESEAKVESKVLKLTELIRVKGVKLAMLTFLCYCATEYTIVCWGSTYLVKYRGVASAVAANWISMYYIGITAGRMLCGFIAMKMNNRKLIRIGLCTVIVGAIIMALPLPAYAARIGLALVGFGCAPVFPGMISETPKRFGKSLSQAVIGAQMSSAYVGILILPVVFGYLAARISMALIPYFLITLVILMLIATTKLNGIKNAEEKSA